MEATKENLGILKKLGFTCNYVESGYEPDEWWYSLKNGWGFRLDAYETFEDLLLELTK